MPVNLFSTKWISIRKIRTANYEQSQCILIVNGSKKDLKKCSQARKV